MALVASNQQQLVKKKRQICSLSLSLRIKLGKKNFNRFFYLCTQEPISLFVCLLNVDLIYQLFIRYWYHSCLSYIYSSLCNYHYVDFSQLRGIQNTRHSRSYILFTSKKEEPEAFCKSSDDEITSSISVEQKMSSVNQLRHANTCSLLFYAQLTT